MPAYLGGNVFSHAHCLHLLLPHLSSIPSKTWTLYTPFSMTHNLQPWSNEDCNSLTLTFQWSQQYATIWQHLPTSLLTLAPHSPASIICPRAACLCQEEFKPNTYGSGSISKCRLQDRLLIIIPISMLSCSWIDCAIRPQYSSDCSQSVCCDECICMPQENETCLPIFHFPPSNQSIFFIMVIRQRKHRIFFSSTFKTKRHSCSQWTSKFSPEIPFQTRYQILQGFLFLFTKHIY